MNTVEFLAVPLNKVEFFDISVKAAEFFKIPLNVVIFFVISLKILFHVLGASDQDIVISSHISFILTPFQVVDINQITLYRLGVIRVGIAAFLKLDTSSKSNLYSAICSLMYGSRPSFWFAIQ